MLEPVGHPAMAGQGAAKDQDGGQERERRPPGQRRRGTDVGFDGRPPKNQEADEHDHVHEIDPSRPTPVPELDIRGHGRDRQEADEDPGLLATERRQANASAAIDQLAENRRMCRARGQGGQEVEQGHRRHEQGAELVQAEDRRAEEPGLRAPGERLLGHHADVEGQPGQERAGEREPDEHQAPAVGAERLAEPADDQRADHGEADGELEPGEVEYVHENSSNVPKCGLT